MKDTENKSESATNVEFYVATYEANESDEQPYTEVLAVFVDEKYYSDANIGYGRVTKEDVENTFNGYLHFGQHCAVSQSFIAENCRKANETEYRNLFNELENSVGYNLKIV